MDETKFEYTNIGKNETKIDIYKNNKLTGSVKCYIMSGKVLDKLVEKISCS